MTWTRRPGKPPLLCEYARHKLFRVRRLCGTYRLARVVAAILKDGTELFKPFSDYEGFKKWLTDTVFALTYDNSGNSARPI